MSTRRGPIASPTGKTARSWIVGVLALLSASIAVAVIAVKPTVQDERAPTRMPAGPVEFGGLADEIVSLVRERFVDGRAAAGWAARHAGYGRSIADHKTFTAETRRRLAELGVSHTARYVRSDPEHAALLAIFGGTLGVDPEPIDTIGVDLAPGHIVRRVLAGGAAEQAGMRRGDRIVLADALPFEPVDSLRGRAGLPIVLTIERHHAGEPIELSVVPQKMRPADEWIMAQRLGTRPVDRDGVRITVVPMVSCAGAGPRAELERTLREIASDAPATDTLVLDFRGGWGGCPPDLLDLFCTLVPDLALRGRDGPLPPIDIRWRKPLVILVDEATRSGKEVVARTVQRHKRGLVIGARTAGAVSAGQCFPLRDGALLYLAVLDATVDGERLEGVGVTPDIIVAENLLHANGDDPPLDRAITEAIRLHREAGW